MCHRLGVAEKADEDIALSHDLRRFADLVFFDAYYEDRMSNNGLFRTAALEAQRTQWHGRIVIVAPPTLRALSLLAAAIALLLVAFGVLGTYTKRTTVIGQVTPSAGLIKVHAQTPAVVVESRVAEGQRVAKGDVLFVLSNERTSSTRGDAQAAITQQARLRQESLIEQLANVERLMEWDKHAMEEKGFSLRQDLQRLRNLLDSQRERVTLTENALERYQHLSEQGFVNHDQLLAKQTELLDQRARLQSLERERIAAKRTLAEVENQLQALPLKYDAQQSELRRLVASTEQELTESEVRRRFDIVATESGVATAITANLGQTVDVSRPLVSIVPAGSAWQAELYAPSRSIGFLQRGDRVRIRYHAFPYQKFGQYTGSITSIASTALSSTELTGSNAFSAGGAPSGEPLYRVSIKLDSPTITAYGQQKPLQAGMILEADVLQETRRLYEWVLEPLYSLSGKI